MAYARYKTETFAYVAETIDSVRRVPASDELFDELKAKDDQARGKKAVRTMLASRGSAKSPQQEVESRPASSATLAAEEFFNSVPAKGLRSSLQQELFVSRTRRERAVAKAAQALSEQVAKTVRETMEELADRRERGHEAEESREVGDWEDQKPYKVTALPPIKRKVVKMRPLPGVSYLSTSGLYQDMIQSRRPFKLGHMTRRNITENKISNNILTHNTPVGV